ncbi:hypothetical protein YB2330_004111 [Saitoella coloradoensis]
MEVKGMYMRHLELYNERAWGHDEVLPETGEPANSRNGWGATIVDSIDTCLLMDLVPEALRSIEHTLKVDFTKTHENGRVDPFETIIRYVGGLLSAHDLLTTVVLPRSKVKDLQKGLLRQAKTLADQIGPGFDSPTGMLYPGVDFAQKKGHIEDRGTRSGAVAGDIANIGTNWLEYAKLSVLTGDDVYVRNASRAWSLLVNPPQHSFGFERTGGLVATPVDIMSGRQMSDRMSWGAKSDSYYEYLIKAWLMAPKTPSTEQYRHAWTQAVHAAKVMLISQTNHKTDPKKFIGEWRFGNRDSTSEHLACFAGGNFVLGGKALGNQEYIDAGLELIEGCRWVYEQTSTKLGPEAWRWIATTDDNPQKPDKHAAKHQYSLWGFWATNTRYHLRPEYVESLFYAYRITGNVKYADWAWEVFESIGEHCESEWGYSDIKDVTGYKGTRKLNNQESYFGAETLKYLYLIFADPRVGSLDEWVYNTEAHPLRIERKAIGG